MAMIQFTKEEAEVSGKTVVDMFDALNAAGQTKFTVPLAEVLVFLSAVKAEAPSKK